MLQIEVNEKKCNGSGTCLKVCPKGPRIWKMEGEGKDRKAIVVDKSFCLLCGMCFTLCPTDAITIRVANNDHEAILGAQV
ncbi:MAG: 4Fe-4S dicluster domain-containing protein [Desulfatiglandales bacterium]